jgi:hypothetical protein
MNAHTLTGASHDADMMRRHMAVIDANIAILKRSAGVNEYAVDTIAWQVQNMRYTLDRLLSNVRPINVHDCAGPAVRDYMFDDTACGIGGCDE